MLLGMLLCVGCEQEEAKFRPDLSVVDAQPWVPEQIVGWCYRLIDEREVRDYLGFRADGSVPATYGLSDGPLTGTIMKWRIDADGSLEISDSMAEQMCVLTLLYIDEGRAVVLEDDMRRDYTREQKMPNQPGARQPATRPESKDEP